MKPVGLDIVQRYRFIAARIEENSPPKPGEWDTPYLLREAANKIESLQTSRGRGPGWFREISIDAIARTAHEVNRAYCQSLGDESQREWDRAPAWQKESVIKGVLAYLDNPRLTPEQSHQNWMAEKERDGWVYGETKDEEAKTHPCMVPYDQLPAQDQAKDLLFRAVVLTLLGYKV